MNKLIKVGRLTVNNNSIGWIPDPEAILANCGDGKDVYLVPDIHLAILNPPSALVALGLIQDTSVRRVGRAGKRKRQERG